MKKLFSLLATLLVLALAIWIGRTLWVHYMETPWTRDGRVRADIINVAADVTGEVVDVPVRDNQLVKKGDLLMQIDPEHYRIAVEASAIAGGFAQGHLGDAQGQRPPPRRPRQPGDLQGKPRRRQQHRRLGPGRLPAGPGTTGSRRTQPETHPSRWRRWTAMSPTSTCIAATTRASARRRLAVVDMNSFWVYGFFEETKLPHVSVGDKADMQLMSGEVLKGHVGKHLARHLRPRQPAKAAS